MFHFFRKNKPTLSTINPVADPSALNAAIKHCRSVSNAVETWLPSFENSWFNYGIPDEIVHFIDQKIDDQICYTDLLAYYSRLLETISYLELGVSVGKNFWPLVNYWEHAEAIAFDIENMPPVLYDALGKPAVIDSWPSPHQSLRKQDATFAGYKYKTNTIHYMAADIYDELAWKKLCGKKFNLIFSDALHSAEALHYEIEMLIKYNLLAKDFIIFWDDLSGEMRDAFFDIASGIQRKRLLKKTELYLIEANGWLGQHYPHKHPVGIISTISLK